MKTALKSSGGLNGEDEAERTASPLTPALLLRGEGVALDASLDLDALVRAPALPSARILVSPERGIHAASTSEHPPTQNAADNHPRTETVHRAPSPLNGERAGVRGENAPSRPISVKLPTISPLLLRWFTWYCRGYLRRHFHSLRVSRAGLPPHTRGLPLVIYTNHASWWDPLVGLIIKDTFFAERTLFTPIDAAMLTRYRMFAKLGFFGVEQRHRRGAVQFLHTSEAILQSPQHLLAVTPQSRFADVRERPLKFQAGLGHLATRVEHAVFLPMATEFVFWEERLPEILVRFGEPVEVRREHATAFTHDYWTDLFEQKLEANQDALSVETQRRNSSEFQTLLIGGAGQGGFYDLWRALKARLRGESFIREHGAK